jgi:RecJ-like exonuclease
MEYVLFLESIKKAAATIKNIDNDGIIRVISHLDADGICSASLITNALTVGLKSFKLSVVKQLSEDVLLELSKEAYSNYIFTDLGSGQYTLIEKHLSDKKVLILDHHSFDLEILKTINPSITIINPHIFGIDGAMELAGSGVVYLFSEAMDEKNKNTAYLAIIGAIGDVQEKDGFIGLNNIILKTAIGSNKIKAEKGLKWFGLETRPLHKILEYSTDPTIPGVSGSESNAFMFLHGLGIDPKKNKEWKKYNDLDQDEKMRLVSSIIMKRSKEKDPEAIIGMRYILVEEEEGSPFHDAREFSTLLNACGRMGKAEIGIAACLGDKESKEKALVVMAEYKGEIVSALRWYNDPVNKESISAGKGYIIINAEDKVSSTIIGTLASILSKSDEFAKGTFILSIARSDDDMTKVSLRVAKDDTQFDMREIINRISAGISNESGGHKNAAGAIIPSDKEKEFIMSAVKVFEEIGN